ncbi:MAG: 1-acyl-sn-glycerol-3-phosphate acyltransferase [bacterium]
MMHDAPLFRFNTERPHLVTEVTRRVYAEHLTRSRTNSIRALEYVLNDTAFQELERLRLEQGPEDEIRPREWWKSTARRLSEMSEDEKRAVLRELIEAYTEDTAGRFEPRVFKFASGVLPVGLSFLFKTQDVRQLPSATDLSETVRHLRDLEQRVDLQGPLEQLRRLARKGTLVVVPTHSSNMDSILMGWALEQCGLPPVTYGAGKNLFTNPLTSFFMHNLGAYKVDRRIKHDLYKDVLKTYSQVLLENGYHSLFFPGGTRCRSNIVEDKLKLGLLGTAVTASIRNYQADRYRPIYICPVTINYNLVLEAESLIREHLRREGGARYFLENDEFNQIATVIRFVMNTVRMDAQTVIRFGQPLDVFGNHVEADGSSYDARGRQIDALEFMRSVRTGEVVEDVARDREYTRHAGIQIGHEFRKNTVILSSAVVAFALFELLAKRFPNLDVYQLVRLNFEETIPWHELRSTVGEAISDTRELAHVGKVQLSDTVRTGTLDEILDQGVRSLMMFHIPSAISYVPSGVRINKVDLLLFYGNRLRTFGLNATDILARAKV